MVVDGGAIASCVIWPCEMNPAPSPPLPLPVLLVLPPVPFVPCEVDPLLVPLLLDPQAAVPRATRTESDPSRKSRARISMATGVDRQTITAPARARHRLIDRPALVLVAV